MKILTATEIKQRNKDYFDNPNPELQKVYESMRKLQEYLFLPLIKKAIKLLKN